MKVLKKSFCVGLIVFSAFFMFFSCASSDDDDTVTAVPVLSNSCTVKLYSNGGIMQEGGSKSFSVQRGTVLTLTSSAALGLFREGYNFKGWSESNSATSYTTGKDFRDGASITVNSDLSLYAIWRQIDPVYYSVNSTASLRDAVSQINNVDKDYFISISGSVTGSISLVDTFLNMIYASSITIQGATGAATDSLSGNIDIRTRIPVTIKNITLQSGTGFSFNDETYGGGLYIAKGSEDISTVKLNGVIIKQNSATYGAGIYNHMGTLTVSSSQILNNMGSGLYNNGGTVILQDTKIENNSVTGANGSGGGIYNFGGNMNMDSGSIKENSGAFGAGLYNTGTFTLKGGKIESNTATDYAGGVLNKGTFDLYGGSISENSVTAPKGYGAGVVNEAGFTVYGGSISKNTAVLKGAGVLNKSSGIFTVISGEISENALSDDSGQGAGIYNDGTLLISAGKIEKNVAKSKNVSSFGGGIYNTKFLTMTNGSILNNESTNGGGIANIGSSAQCILKYGSVNDNKAKNGAGLYIDGGSVKMTSDDLKKSSYLSQYASVIDNVADEKGGGVYVENGSLSVEGGIISAFGTRTASDGRQFEKGNKADVSGKAWFKNGGTVYVNGSEQTESFCDSDVVVKVSGWISVSS